MMYFTYLRKSETTQSIKTSFWGMPISPTSNNIISDTSRLSFGLSLASVCLFPSEFQVPLLWACGVSSHKSCGLSLDLLLSKETLSGRRSLVSDLVQKCGICQMPPRTCSLHLLSQQSPLFGFFCGKEKGAKDGLTMLVCFMCAMQAISTW